MIGVVLAGGSGNRLWPRSRQQTPKQFDDLLAQGESLLQATCRRISPLLPSERTWVVTGRSTSHLVRQQLPHLDRARILSETLDDATTQVLLNGKAPSRKVNELDNRGSHYYLALYWARALAAQDSDAELKARFTKLADELGKNEATIVNELNEAQGKPVELGGYFRPADDLADAAMRASTTLNGILAEA